MWLNLIGRSRFYKKEKLIFTGNRDGLVQVKIADGLRAFRWFSAHSTRVNSIDICEESNILATGSDDLTIKLWKLPSLQIIKTFNEFPFSVKCVTFKFRKMFNLTYFVVK